jgi:hypothetical protein
MNCEAPIHPILFGATTSLLPANMTFQQKDTTLSQAQRSHGVDAQLEHFVSDSTFHSCLLVMQCSLVSV